MELSDVEDMGGALDSFFNDPDGKTVSDRFAAWIWEDPERRARLAGRYNQLFNSIVLPVWDRSHQTFPGLSPTFRPHPHQIDAVWRAVQEPSVLLGHTVGAGKTAIL